MRLNCGKRRVACQCLIDYKIDVWYVHGAQCHLLTVLLANSGLEKMGNSVQLRECSHLNVAIDSRTLTLTLTLI